MQLNISNDQISHYFKPKPLIVRPDNGMHCILSDEGKGDTSRKASLNYNETIVNKKVVNILKKREFFTVILITNS